MDDVELHGLLQDYRSIMSKCLISMVEMRGLLEHGKYNE